MSHSDELRILAEMGTFTQRDFADATECTKQWASTVFEQLTRERVIERVRVGKSYLYALTERGKARVAKMKPIDPEERCLPLVHLSVTERYMHHNGLPVLDTSEDDALVIFEECRVCKHLYCNLGSGLVCDTCRRMWEI